MNLQKTHADTTIHFTSNHPLEHKLAEYIFYIGRMITLPITEQEKHQEWNIFLIIQKDIMVFHYKLFLIGRIN